MILTKAIIALKALSLIFVLILAREVAAQCPTYSYANAAWPEGKVVYFSLTGVDSVTATGVKNALGQWTSANGSNNSGISFQPATESNPAIYTFSNTPVSAPGGGAVCTPPSYSAAQTCTRYSGSNVTSAVTVFNPKGVDNGIAQWNSTQSNYPTALIEASLHEIGHTMGLKDLYGSTPNTVMNQFTDTNDSGGSIPSTTQTCDQNAVKASSFYPPAPPPPPPPPPPPICIAGQTPCNNCQPPACPEEEVWSGNTPPPGEQACVCYIATSPIIIDTDGEGFNLTSASGGVVFDFFGTGNPGWISWTQERSTNGWLALDRNGNGLIDSGKELFGNITDQPASENPNGFRALAVFDQASEGGNDDGVIDAQDAIWPQLKVWIDKNHDGISEKDELFSLDQIGVEAIRLGYSLFPWTDQYGNSFRYKGSLRKKKQEDVDRVIYDVFLVQGSGTP